MTDPFTEWVTSESLDFEEIEQRGADILANPAFTVKAVGSQTKTFLYTREQMLEMYRYGYSLSQKPHTYMRNMEIGQSAVFPFKHWSTVRSAASMLKKRFGVVFAVKKLPQGDIKVTRKS